MPVTKTEEIINEILELPDDSPVAKDFVKAFPITSVLPRISEIEYWLGQQGIDTTLMGAEIDNLYRALKLAKAFDSEKLMLRERRNISNPERIYRIVEPEMRGLKQEILMVIALDTKNNATDKWTVDPQELKRADKLRQEDVIAKETIFKGSLNTSIIHAREVFRFAVMKHADSIVLAHNHPSGDTAPSPEDIHTTKELVKCGNIMGIKLTDHIIVGDGSYLSMREEMII